MNGEDFDFAERIYRQALAWKEGRIAQNEFYAFALRQLQFAILAEREALQAEIVKRLRIERAEASPNAWLALNAAIGIVQAVFAQQSQIEPIEETSPQSENGEIILNCAEFFS